jgi:hypothetical protein
MSCLLRQQRDGRWERQDLPEGTMTVPLASGSLVLARLGQGAERITVLLVCRGLEVRANGHPVLGGMKALQHKDELLIGCERIYYSAESQPEITTFPIDPGARPPRCVVCRVALGKGNRMVQCPQCGRCYHQDDHGEQKGKNCWTYRPQCLCGHPTLLSGEACWKPDDEDPGP